MVFLPVELRQGKNVDFGGVGFLLCGLVGFFVVFFFFVIVS